MKFLGKIEDVQVTSHKILVAIRGLFVCLLAYYLKTYEYISVKFSGKIEDSTSNEPLDLVAICVLAEVCTLQELRVYLFIYLFFMYCLYKYSFYLASHVNGLHPGGATLLSERK